MEIPADAGYEACIYMLDRLLAEEGRVEQLRSRSDTGDYEPAVRLAELLADRVCIDEAITVLKKHAARDVVAAERLVELLVQSAASTILRQRPRVRREQSERLRVGPASVEHAQNRTSTGVTQFSSPTRRLTMIMETILVQRPALGDKGRTTAVTRCCRTRRGSSTTRTVGSADIPPASPPTPPGGRGQ
jgi:hypothetical protein